MDCSTSSMASNQIMTPGAVKTYVVRTVLPGIIPPSYRGATIRYLYYLRCTFLGRWLVLESSHNHRETSKDPIKLEARIPLQVWVTQKSNGLLMEQVQTDGVVPTTTIPLNLFWKEMYGDSEWARANDLDDGVEDGYESLRDEISSVSSYNAIKENVHKNLGGSLSFQSFAVRSSNSDTSHAEIGRRSLSSIPTLPHLSVAEVPYEPTADVLSPEKSSAILCPSHQKKITEVQTEEDSVGVSTASGMGNNGPGPSEGFVRGRSYNIRIDDQVLLRFSPKNSESTYYFSDVIGGTLTFFHEEGPRRCLEVTMRTCTGKFICITEVI
uniref:Uncharacterized protein LOC105114154 isoform X1 n=1 Tax=Rhizophora mucronata TaxID=61149 RepID=A0A2P2KEI3_RHIMU